MIALAPSYVKRPVPTMLNLGWFLAANLCLLASCRSEPDPGSEPPDRNAVFRQLGEQVIAPTLEAFATQASGLEAATQAFCDAPSLAQLATAQQAWRSTREPWSLCEAAGFGPVDGLGVANNLNFWPARPENIESALNLHDSFDPVTIAQLGASAKGMPAIEYLLFGDSFRDSDVLVTYTTGVQSELRCSYMVALASDLHTRASTLHSAWVDDGYLEEFVHAGNGSPTFPNEQDAVDLLVNTIVAELSFIVATKLDKPLTTSGSPVEVLESRFADDALTDLRHNLEGVAGLYRGQFEATGGSVPGLHTLVGFVDPTLDQRIEDKLGQVLATAEAMQTSLRLTLADQPASVTELRDQIDELRRLFKLEVVSALSVTLSLSDNDGD